MMYIPLLNRIYRIFFPKYKDSGGKKLFKSLFGNTRLSQALCNTFVSTYALSKPDAHLCVFSSQKVKKNVHQGGSDFLISDLALATSAAPTFFPPRYIRHLQKGVIRKTPYPFVDGAIAMNNMSLFLYAHARKKHPEHPIHILSLGIRQKPTNNETMDVKRMGLISWLKKASCLIVHSQASGHQAILKKLISQSTQKDIYERIQPMYGPSFQEFDNISEKHIKEILKIAEKTLQNHKKCILSFLEKKNQ